MGVVFNIKLKLASLVHAMLVGRLLLQTGQGAAVDVCAPRDLHSSYIVSGRELKPLLSNCYLLQKADSIEGEKKTQTLSNIDIKAIVNPPCR